MRFVPFTDTVTIISPSIRTLDRQRSVNKREASSNAGAPVISHVILKLSAVGKLLAASGGAGVNTYLIPDDHGKAPTDVPLPVLPGPLAIHPVAAVNDPNNEKILQKLAVIEGTILTNQKLVEKTAAAVSKKLRAKPRENVAATNRTNQRFQNKEMTSQHDEKLLRGILARVTQLRGIAERTASGTSRANMRNLAARKRLEKKLRGLISRVKSGRHDGYYDSHGGDSSRRGWGNALGYHRNSDSWLRHHHGFGRHRHRNPHLKWPSSKY